MSHHKHYTDAVALLAQLHGTTTDIIRPADRARRRGSSRETAIRTRHRCDSGTGNRNGEPASSPRRSCRQRTVAGAKGKQ
jgi:hypothetical protein